MNEPIEIAGWACKADGDDGTRWAYRETGVGEFHAWLLADGSLETEFRPNEPDEAGHTVKLPTPVVAWLVVRPEPPPAEPKGPGA